MAKEFAVLILPITAFLLIIFFLHNIWRIIPSGLIFRYITSKRTWKILIKIIYSGEFQITDDQTYGHGAFSIGIDFLEFIFDPFFRERQNDRKFKSRAVCWSCDFRHCYTLWFGNLYELIFFEEFIPNSKQFQSLPGSVIFLDSYSSIKTCRCLCTISSK